MAQGQIFGEKAFLKAQFIQLILNEKKLNFATVAVYLNLKFILFHLHSCLAFFLLHALYKISVPILTLYNLHCDHHFIVKLGSWSNSKFTVKKGPELTL